MKRWRCFETNLSADYQSENLVVVCYCITMTPIGKHLVTGLLGTRMVIPLINQISRAPISSKVNEAKLLITASTSPPFLPPPFPRYWVTVFNQGFKTWGSVVSSPSGNRGPNNFWFLPKASAKAGTVQLFPAKPFFDFIPPKIPNARISTYPGCVNWIV